MYLRSEVNLWWTVHSRGVLANLFHWLCMKPQPKSINNFENCQTGISSEINSLCNLSRLSPASFATDDMPLARALSPGACAILAMSSGAFPGQLSKYWAISSGLQGASPRHLELSWRLEYLRLVGCAWSTEGNSGISGSPQGALRCLLTRLIGSIQQEAVGADRCG